MILESMINWEKKKRKILGLKKNIDEMLGS